MSQNPFGTPTPPAEPLPVEPVEEAATTHRGLLIGGLGALAAIVVAGGAFLALSGDDDSVDAALVTPPRVPATTSATTAPTAPLPTLAQFNGRNPFKAKIVEAAAGGGGTTDGGTTDGGGTTGGTTDGGTTGGTTGGTDIPTDAPTGTSPDGEQVVLVPGPVRTVEVPGPTETVTVPGPVKTVPGPTKTVEKTVEKPVDRPVLVPLDKGSIELVFLGLDAEAPDPEDETRTIPGDPALPDFSVNGVILQDIPANSSRTPADESIFAYYFRVVSVDAGHDDPAQDRVRVQFGDELRWVKKDVAETF